jgi:hypothetical protein
MAFWIESQYVHGILANWRGGTTEPLLLLPPPPPPPPLLWLQYERVVSGAKSSLQASLFSGSQDLTVGCCSEKRSVPWGVSKAT